MTSRRPIPTSTITRIATAAAICATFLAVGAERATAVISVFPSPETPVASDRTTFSFRDLDPAELGKVKIVGSRTGRHGGRRLEHSDGRGVSIVPRRKFARGEVVRVRTSEEIIGARRGDYKIRIGRFYSNDQKQNRPRGRNTFKPLKSRPGLRPPKLDVKKTDPAAGDGEVFFAPKETGLTISDRLGRISWFRPTEAGGRGQEVQSFRAQTYRGAPVLTYWRGAASRHGQFQVGRFHILNQDYTEIAMFGMGNGYQPDAHEIVISSRDTALAIAYRGLTWDLRKYGGKRNGKVFDNVIQEIDISTGAVLFEWHSIGNVNLGHSVSRPEKSGYPWDYFHANSIDDDGDALLISARKTSTIYRIDRQSGDVIWRLRGDGRWRPGTNDFDMGRGTQFGYQHDAQRLPNGDISLFDNAVARQFKPVRRESSALILRLAGGKARLVKRFNHPKHVSSLSQGSTDVMPNGHVFVGWGSERQMTEFSPTGDVLFDATFEAPVNSYRAHMSPWVGQPTGRPAIASIGDEDGGTVWASWNGSTLVRSWRVLTGPDQGDLHEAEVANWTGLETTIQLRHLEGWVQIEALDESGQLLSSSRVMKVGQRSHGKPLDPGKPGKKPPPLTVSDAE